MAVIAPNGLGHFRRVIRQLDGLHLAHPRLELGVVCAPWQLEATHGWLPANRLLVGNPRVALAELPDTFRWVNDAGAYDEARLSGWVATLERIRWLGAARRVLSDNLAGVLGWRPDAALGGSFLWSDVLGPFAPRNPAVLRFVERERELLASCRPFLLCAADLVMPSAVRQTRSVPLPWLCEWWLERREPTRTIGLLGGATGTLATRMAKIARALLGAGDVELRAERELKRTQFAAEPRVAAFTHDEAGYQALSLAFVRPGAGTLTDCVGAQVPMIALDEPENLEMAHNAKVLARLGIGEVLDSDEAAVRLALENLGRGRWEARVAALAGLKKDGVQRAVDWLANWVGA